MEQEKYPPNFVPGCRHRGWGMSANGIQENFCKLLFTTSKGCGACIYLHYDDANCPLPAAVTERIIPDHKIRHYPPENSTDT